jgi:hypothetical protein|tara:strand:- start:189 stop:404 length:216 start_codon:yes stop_codon:yes gene_type:complete
MNNTLSQILDYECGELDTFGTLQLFSALISDGSVWSLQGHYGRTATALIEDGWVTRSGEVTDKALHNGIIG